MTPAEKYQAEQAQAEIDHHTPTAGAMIGHIISNLKIQENKLWQSRYYAKGPDAFFITSEFSKILTEASAFLDQLNQLMLDEGEVIPTTTEEFSRYSMLEESGQRKYEETSTLIFDTVKDFNTQLLFVTRGMALAEKEEKPGLAQLLQTLYAWLKHQSAVLQRYLGHEVMEDLEEDDED